MYGYCFNIDDVITCIPKSTCTVPGMLWPRKTVRLPAFRFPSVSGSPPVEVLLLILKVFKRYHYTIPRFPAISVKFAPYEIPNGAEGWNCWRQDSAYTGRFW